MDVKVTNTLHHYIGGQKVEGTSGRFGDIYNPATGEITTKVQIGRASWRARA